MGTQSVGVQVQPLLKLAVPVPVDLYIGQRPVRSRLQRQSLEKNKIHVDGQARARASSRSCEETGESKCACTRTAARPRHEAIGRARNIQ